MIHVVGTGDKLTHSALTMGLGGATMLTGKEAMEIRGLMRQGMGIRSIARTLGMSR